ncbi:MAG: TonB-dependent receptor [Alphaproteobacteria bacterium]|nr:TonB-dependent receptor [Alphaproteobacteria bacterium]MCB9928070.1 TonB-dependent receptor [Alphaproteobacteria bacterium]
MIHRPVLAAAFVLAAAPPVAWSAEEPVRLAPLVVSASATPVAASEVGSAVTVITAEEIERQQARSLSDVLSRVPGVAVSRSGPTGSQTQVRIRGGEANHTLVLIDGVELNDPSGASEFDFGNMLAADIERVEVLRGPQSALYGSEAIGGVISITTKRGAGPMSLTLSAEGGSFETGQVHGRFQGSGKGYRFSVGGTAFRTGGVSVAPTSEGNHERDGNDNKTLDINLGFNPLDNLEVTLFGRLVESTIETDPQPFVAGIIGTVDGNDETDTLQRTGRAQVKYSLFDGHWEHIAGIGYHSDRANSVSDSSGAFSSVGEKTRFDYQSNLFFDTPEFAGAKHTLTVLVERENDKQKTASAYGGSDLDITNHGLVGEYRLGLFDRLFLSGSVRHDFNELFADATTYRATAAYLFPATGTRLHGSFGTGVKNPTLFELYGFGPNFVPNPNLQPEKSRGFDIGVEQSVWDDRLTVDLTFFRNRITDLIDGAGVTAINLPGTTKTQGLEVSLTAEPVDGLTLNGQYTYTDSQDPSGTQLVRRPRHVASLNAGYGFLGGRATIDLGIDYNGDQRDYQFSNFFADRRQVTLDRYVKVNVAASYKVTERVELYGRVENLFDEDYQNVFGFSNPGIGAYAGLKIRIGGE